MRMLASRSLLCAALPLLAAGACSSAPGAGGPDAGAATDMTVESPDPVIRARPFELRVPAGLDPTRPTPLLIALHGYRATPFLVDAFFKMDTIVDSAGYLYATPAATDDDQGFPRWNCCGGPGADDVAYLDAVIADVARRYLVDERRVYILGHSNGAAMAYRYACDRAATVAAIVPIAGTYTIDSMRCVPAETVSVLHVNGDKDPNWPGDPPVRDSAVFWAERNGCSPMSDRTGAPFDFVDDAPGAETAVERWTGCRGGVEVALWVMGAQPHEPFLNEAWAPAVWDWLAGHARP